MKKSLFILSLFVAILVGNCISINDSYASQVPTCHNVTPCVENYTSRTLQNGDVSCCGEFKEGDRGHYLG